MNLQRTGRLGVAALAFAVCLPLSARAQQPVKPAADNEARVHRMEIWNGAVRSVHYFSHGYSPGEEAALRDLGRAESELAVADEVQGLRRLYLKNERVLEQRRGQVNPLLYGYSSGYSADLLSGGVGLGYAGLAGYPYGFGSFGNVAGTFGYVGGLSASVSNSLAYGVGNEGVIKDVLARTLADAGAPDTAARAARAYDAAAARVADLKVGEKLRLVKGERTIGPAVTVVMKKDNEKITGNLVSDDGEWITIETAKEDVSVRKADVERIVRPRAEGKPAGQ